MKKRTVYIILLLLFIVNLAAIATFSYNRWFKPREDRIVTDSSEIWNSLQEQVALKPPQLEKMKSLRFAFEKEIISLRTKIWQKRKILLEETRNPRPDLVRIDKAIDELSHLQAEIQKRTIRNILKDKEILSPRQQKRYFSLFEKHLRRPERNWGRRGFGRQGRGLIREFK